jgi:HEPN domain-containing protein
MKTVRGITLMALALTIAGCQDAPTFPDLKTETSEAEQSAALDQAALQVQAALDEQLARGPVDSTRTRRDSTTARPTRPEPHRPNDRGRVELAVALGGEAVEIAARLLEPRADEQQKRLLAEARELQRQAEAALKAGHEQRAMELAESASQTALKAVVLPGGITEQEARMIHDVAQDLLRRAKDAVAANPTDMKRHLLAVAEQLFRVGTEHLGGRGMERALATLWKSATISSWLIG